jgi:hypothetical protein
MASRSWGHRSTGVAMPNADYARRDHFVGWLANQVLRLASPRYRAMIDGSIRYGLAAATVNVATTWPAAAWTCPTCGVAFDFQQEMKDHATGLHIDACVCRHTDAEHTGPYYSTGLGGGRGCGECGCAYFAPVARIDGSGATDA